jgi:hypothetical protein
MFQKQAVWCQCVSTISATLALSSLFSIQTITWYQDVYWSVILLVTTFLNIMVAEHGLYPELLSSMAAIWSGALTLLMTTGNGYSMMAGLILGTLQIDCYFVQLLALVRYPDILSVLILFNVAAEYKYREYRQAVVGTAHSNLKRATAAKAASITSQTFLLWYMRCHNRFPHVYRWTPVVCSLCAFFCGLCWCHCWVAPTVVSHKAMVKSIGHGLVPSLAAAKQCAVCAACLTRLDVEDIFD